MNRIIRLNKTWHFYWIYSMFVVLVCISYKSAKAFFFFFWTISLSYLHEGMNSKPPNFSSGYPKGPDTISILMMS